MIKELNTSSLRLTQTVEYARLGHNMPECGIICQHLCNGLSMGLAGWHICACVGAWRPCRRTSSWRKWGYDKNSESARRSCKVYIVGWVRGNVMRSSCDRGVHNLHTEQMDTVWQFWAAQRYVGLAAECSGGVSASMVVCGCSQIKGTGGMSNTCCIKCKVAKLK